MPYRLACTLNIARKEKLDSSKQNQTRPNPLSSALAPMHSFWGFLCPSLESRSRIQILFLLPFSILTRSNQLAESTRSLCSRYITLLLIAKWVSLFHFYFSSFACLHPNCEKPSLLLLVLLGIVADWVWISWLLSVWFGLELLWVWRS